MKKFNFFLLTALLLLGVQSVWGGNIGTSGGTLYVKNINDYLKVGDTIYAEVIDVDEENFHVKLSIKNISYKRRTYTPKRKIKETSLGFKTLEYKLPIWIKENLEKQEKIIKK